MKWATLLAVVAAAVGLGFVFSPGATAGQAGAPSSLQVASGFGVSEVEGHPLYIHVTVAVAAGENGQAAVARELAARGAQPIRREAFRLSGFTMDDSGDNDGESTLNFNNNSTGAGVKIHYNNAGHPPAVDPGPNEFDGDGAVELAAAMDAWESIDTSAFNFDALVEDYDDPPSLARETPGPSFFNAKNEVGWDRIGGSTLAVAYFATSSVTDPGADMVINNKKVTWTTAVGDPTAPFSNFDLRAVVEHEFGHFLGLIHTTVSEALMTAFYDDIRGLQLDDALGATALYPDGGEIAMISGTVTDSGGEPIPGAIVSLHIAADEPASVSVETDESGGYTIENFIPGQLYIVRASAQGFVDSDDMDGNPADAGVDLHIDFALVASEDGGGPCSNPNSRKPGC